MNILVCYDQSGPKYHRCLFPVHSMDPTGETIKVCIKPTEEQLAWCDILFFNRLIPDMKVEHLTEAKERHGFKMVCDMDDHWILGRDHILHGMYAKHRISEIIEMFIMASDVVTVTHERLYDEVVELGFRESNIHILPNAIPKTDQFQINKVPDEATRLFWAGGITHKNDLEILRRPIQLIRRKQSKDVKFVLAGYDRNQPEWREMAKIFTDNSSFNTAVIESLGIHEYYKVFALCDVMLIPLVETHFNSFKSNLKILEAANVAAPVIVSEVDPYLGFPQDVVNYVGITRTWYNTITDVLSDKVFIQEQGLMLQDYCDEHYNFNKINNERKQIFEHAASKHRQVRKVQAEAGHVDQ